MYEKIFYARIFKNEIMGFYSNELFNKHELDFNFITIDEELWIYISEEGIRFIDLDKYYEFMKSKEEKDNILTIDNIDMFYS